MPPDDALRWLREHDPDGPGRRFRIDAADVAGLRVRADRDGRTA